MWRSLLIGISCGCCLLVSSTLLAQDSGPGPDAAGGAHVYDVTIIKFLNFSTGTYTFNADPVTTPAGSTAAITTTGTFSSVVGTETSTGTWHAVDLGNFAIWYAQASSAASQSTAIGYATPDMIAGRLSTTSTTASTRNRFLRALLQSSYFFGKAQATTTPTAVN